jgi:hypothetical protein
MGFGGYLNLFTNEAQVNYYRFTALQQPLAMKWRTK